MRFGRIQFPQYLLLLFRLYLIDRKLASCERSVGKGAIVDFASLKEQKEELERELDGFLIENRQ